MRTNQLSSTRIPEAPKATPRPAAPAFTPAPAEAPKAAADGFQEAKPQALALTSGPAAEALVGQAPVLETTETYVPERSRGGRDPLIEKLAAEFAKHTVIDYSKARDIVKRELDLAPDGRTECVYTGKLAAGGEGMNIEHTWPQSQGATGPAKSDMFHLYATDTNANSTRSSYPFGIVQQVKWTEGGSKLGLDASGKMVFEPRDQHKGNVARALFYFATVYNHTIPNDEEAVLKQWNIQDPVDAAEKSRSDKIETYQKNRNPFVDQPDLPNQIKDF